jgi:hypothetical protein
MQVQRANVDPALLHHVHEPDGLQRRWHRRQRRPAVKHRTSKSNSLFFFFFVLSCKTARGTNPGVKECGFVRSERPLRSIRLNGDWTHWSLIDRFRSTYVPPVVFLFGFFFSAGSKYVYMPTKGTNTVLIISCRFYKHKYSTKK